MYDFKYSLITNTVRMNDIIKCNGVTRTLKNDAHQRKKTVPTLIHFNCVPLKMVTSLKGNNLLQRERILSFKSCSLWYGNAGKSEFFPLRAVPYGMGTRERANSFL